jgi:hypothetical protein
MYESDADDLIPGLSPEDHQLVPATGKMPPAKVVMAGVACHEHGTSLKDL